jgi:D-amino-acid dehydrogenase
MIRRISQNENDVIVVGAGIIGLTTAYILSLQGQKVTLVEAESEVASGCSFSNAALLTPAMSYPLNAPGSIAQFFRSFLPGRSAFSIQLNAALPFLGWGLSFLRRANKDDFADATTKNYALANYSLLQTALLSDKLQMDFDNTKRGSLKLFNSVTAYEAAKKNGAHFAGTDLSMKYLDSEETCKLEPLLYPVGDSIAGSVYYDQDESGDSAMFARRIAKEFEATGGSILLNTRAIRINTENDSVTSLETSGGEIPTDKIVVATGHDANGLLREVGLRLPIAPLRGITITIDGVENDFPSIPIIDAAANVVLTRLGSRLRVSGFAELSGQNKEISADRVQVLVKAVERLFPNVGRQIDVENLQPWAGLRPVSADGVPIIGETKVKNLFVNAGHGHLGWTMAVGSANILAAQIAGNTADIDPKPYSPSRL